MLPLDCNVLRKRSFSWALACTRACFCLLVWGGILALGEIRIEKLESLVKWDSDKDSDLQYVRGKETFLLGTIPLDDVYFGVEGSDVLLMAQVADVTDQGAPLTG